MLALFVMQADGWVGYILVLELDGVGESFRLGCFDITVVDSVMFW